MVYTSASIKYYILYIVLRWGDPCNAKQLKFLVERIRPRAGWTLETNHNPVSDSNRQ